MIYCNNKLHCHLSRQLHNIMRHYLINVTKLFFCGKNQVNPLKTLQESNYYLKRFLKQGDLAQNLR